MQITVLRQACCMADDMTMPLELVLDLPDDATLKTLAERVAGADFLQFSSTHRTLTGFAGPRAGAASDPLLTISAGHLGGLLGAGVRYRVPPATPLRACLPGGRLDLVFLNP